MGAQRGGPPWPHKLREGGLGRIGRIKRTSIWSPAAISFLPRLSSGPSIPSDRIALSSSNAGWFSEL